MKGCQPHNIITESGAGILTVFAMFHSWLYPGLKLHLWRLRYCWWELQEEETEKQNNDVIFVSYMSLLQVVWRIYLIFHMLQTFKRKVGLDFFKHWIRCLATASCITWCCYDFHLLERKKKNINKIISLQIRKVGKWVTDLNECMIHLQDSKDFQKAHMPWL